MDAGTLIIKTAVDKRDFYEGLKEIEDTTAKDIEVLFGIDPKLNTTQLIEEFQETAGKLNQMTASGIIKQEDIGYIQMYIEHLKALNKRIEELGGKRLDISKSLGLSELSEDAEKFSKNDVQKIQKGMKGISGDVKQVGSKIAMIGKSMMGIVASAIGWAFAMLGVRSAYSMIQQSMSVVSSYNDQFKSDLAYMKFAIASTLQPVVETLVKWAYQLLAIVGAVIKTLTGYNIFQNATIENFKKSQGAIDKTNKKAKELRKTIASFDELNIMQDTSSSGSSGGVNFTPPSIDLATTDLFKNWNLEDVAKKINKFFAETDWEGLAKGIGDAIVWVFNNIGTFIDAVDWELVGRSLMKFFLSLPWDDIAEACWKLYLKWIKAMIKLRGGETKVIAETFSNWFYETFIKDKTIEEQIGGIGKFIAEIVLGRFVGGFIGAVWQAVVDCVSELIKTFKKALGLESDDGESKEFETMGSQISGSIGKGININSILNPFNGIGTKIGEKFNSAKGEIEKRLNPVATWIKEKFIPSISQKLSTFGSKIGDIVGEPFKKVINVVLNVIESTINGAIKKLNTLIKGINSVGEFLHLGRIGELKDVKLPRLAKGGIVNLPSKGVPVGGAIAGERGAEGVIPLTDSQQMQLLGEAIGRYITINANITNTMNGRVISRELQKINNENDFAYNR